MPKVLALLALCIVTWVAPGCANGETTTGAGSAAGPRAETVMGQVVDLYCLDPETKANAGMDHSMGRECAWACVKWWGQPVGILTADGRIYQLAGGLVANNNEKIAPHVTHTVTITGDVAEKDGINWLTANDLTMAGAPAK